MSEHEFPIIRPALGEYLKAHREQRGVSMRSLGTDDLHSSHLSQIESGKVSDPRISTLLRLSEAYDIPVDIILADVYGIEVEEIDEERALAIGQTVLQLPESSQDWVISYAEFLHKRSES